MSTVSILINCPRQVQIDIEEICMVEGMNFSDYFLQLHEKNVSNMKPKSFESPSKIDVDDVSVSFTTLKDSNKNKAKGKSK